MAPPSPYPYSPSVGSWSPEGALRLRLRQIPKQLNRLHRCLDLSIRKITYAPLAMHSEILKFKGSEAGIGHPG